jgi:Na+/proline symporter
VYRLPLRIAYIQDSSGAGRERVGFVRPQRRRANVSSSLEIMLQIRESRVHLVDSVTSSTGQSPVKIVQSDPSPITTVPMSLLRISFFAVVFLTLSGESKSIKRDKKMLKVSNIFLASVCLLFFFFAFFVTPSYYDFRVLFLAVPMDFHPAHAFPFYYLIWFGWFRPQFVSGDDYANHFP